MSRYTAIGAGVVGWGFAALMTHEAYSRGVDQLKKDTTIRCLQTSLAQEQVAANELRKAIAHQEDELKALRAKLAEEQDETARRKTFLMAASVGAVSVATIAAIAGQLR